MPLLLKKLQKKKRLIILISIILGLAVFSFLFYFLFAKESIAWYSSSWMYRREIVVNNTSGSSLSNEDILVQLDTQSLISANKLQSDCDDIRFLELDNQTILNYWIEDGCNTSSTQIWVRIPTLPTEGKSIYLYYGNSGATKGSSNWTGSITLLADSTCPSGWTTNTDLNGYFPYGSSSYGTYNNDSTHSHNGISGTSTSISGTSISGISSGNFSGAPSSHTHATLTATFGSTDSSNALPPYQTMTFCSNNKFTIPQNLISIFEDSVPSGWTRFASLDNRFPLGNNTPLSQGGATSHSHSFVSGGTTASAGTSQATSQFYSSSGAHGAITIASGTTVNLDTTNVQTGRSCSQGGDAVNYSVTGLTANTATLSTSPVSTCLTAGDKVLLINLQGTASYYGNVGWYDVLTVQSIASNVVTFTTNKLRYYGNGASDDTNIGTSTSNQRVMLQRIPQYTNVTINGTLTASAWNGVKGGVLAFFASGTVNVASTGIIHTNNLGYRKHGSYRYGGESYTSVGGGGLGGAYPTLTGGVGTAGGGGGGGAYGNNGWGYGGNGTSIGGAGGGGGNGGGSSAAEGGGGGGGGYGTGGGGGGGYVAGTAGTTSSGAGGRANAVEGDSTRGYGGGGGGGGTRGNTDLSKLYLGSAGGYGGQGGSTPGSGGNAGGIVFVHGETFTVSGYVRSLGEAGAAGTGSGAFTSGGGGGGSGGSIRISGNSVTLGTSRVLATGGAAGGGPGKAGGAGGSGRIAVHYKSSISGTSSPTSTNYSTPTTYYSISSHTHSVTSGTMSTEEHLPPYRDVLYAKNNSEKYIDPNSIIITNSIPPYGWESYTPLISKFPRGSSTSGGTGGSATHTHSVTISTGSPSATLQGYGSGSTFASSSHTHSLSTNSNSVSNLRSYYEVIFIKRKSSQSVTLQSEEAYNIVPNAPTSLQTEGQTNPARVGDLTPEFSAVFSDPDSGDTGIYYRVEVNTNNTFTGTVMWDSGKTSISPITNNTRSSDISYDGTTLPNNGTTYYWRIKFWDNGDVESPWSATAQFTMDYPPNAPSSLQTEGATNPTQVADTTPEFSAIFSDAVGDTGIYYRVEVNTNNTFTGTVMWDSGKISISPITHNTRSSDISYDGTTLSNNGTTYYWRIKFWNQFDSESAWSATAQFTMNITPNAPTSLQTEGVSNNINVGDTTPEFSAIFSDPNTGATGIYYMIEVNTSSTFDGISMWDSPKTSITPITNNARSSEISYTGTTLTTDGTLYYWRIKFWDNNDVESEWSNYSYFRMSKVPNAPTDLLTQGRVNPGFITSANPTFSAIYTDINEHDATAYEIELNTNSSFTGTVMWDTGKLSTSIANGYRSPEYTYAGSTLSLTSITYYWRIRFWDSDDLMGPWSETAHFVSNLNKQYFEGLNIGGIYVR